MHFSQRRVNENKADSMTVTAKFANGKTMSPEGLSILFRLGHVGVFNEGLHRPYFYMEMQSIIQTNIIHSNFYSLGS